VKLRSLVAVATVMSLVSGAAACGNTTTDAGTRLTVVATTTQVADFARDIGGDRVDVTQILKPNIDPHDYEPTPADLTAIGAAKVLVKSGVGVEEWLDATVASAGFRGTLADASAGVKIRQGAGDEAEHGDPHIWHDPRNAKLMAQNIEKAFTAAAPADAATFAKHLAGYSATLDALDAGIAAKIAGLPAGNRKLVTNHDAFGYYIDRYHLTFVGSIIPSFDTSAELSGVQIQQLIEKIKSTGTKAIFSESSLPPRTAETIGREAGVKVEAGEDSLYGDTLGPKGSDGDTYLKAEEHNTKTIVGALGGH
jgi:zinc/manganese transport system substrate-binding protein